MEIFLSVICFFSLTDFNICSFCLIFVRLINMCLGLFHLWYILLGLSGFLGLGWLFPSPFFNYYLLKYVLMPFLFIFFSGTPMIQILGHLTSSQSSLRLSSFLFIIFFFFPLCLICYTILSSSYSTVILLSYSTVSSLQSVFNLSYFIVHY